LKNFLKITKCLIIYGSIASGCQIGPAFFKQKSEDSGARNSEDAFKKNRLPDEPTNPDGSKIKGFDENMTQAEKDIRVTRNIRQPIEFGVRAAGINFDTTFADAKALLSVPILTTKDEYRYVENGELKAAVSHTHVFLEKVKLQWKLQEKNTVHRITVGSGYLGLLTVPGVSQPVKMGDTFARWFTPFDPGQSLAIILGQAFEGKDETYICLNFRTCTIEQTLNEIKITFVGGHMSFATDPSFSLIEISFSDPREIAEPLALPIEFGQSIGSVTPKTIRPAAEQVLGTPIDFNQYGEYVYDRGNVTVDWSRNIFSLPQSITVLIGYQGSVTFPAPLGQLNLGDEAKDHFAVDPKGEGLMLSLGRELDGKSGDAAYDCQKVNSCFQTETDIFVIFQFDKGLIVFDKRANFRIHAVMIFAAPIARSAPVTDPVVFPDSVAGVTFAAKEADVEAVLGETRGLFRTGENSYDNDNIQITYKNETAEVINILDRFSGAINVPSDLWQAGATDAHMGDEFSEAFASGNDYVMKTLYNHFIDPDLDCLVAKTCEWLVENQEIRMYLRGMGMFAFSDDGKNTLERVRMYKSQKLPPEEKP
jgi:hypothetical protein